MEERRKNLVLALGLYMSLYMVVQHVVNMQSLILQGEWEKFVIFSILFGSLERGERTIWSHVRQVGFTDRLLLGSFTEKMFKQRTRVCHGTFRFLCEKLGPFLGKKSTPMRAAISVETRIAVSLCRLGTGNGLLLVGEVFGIANSTASCIVREFCKVVRKHLLKVLVQFPSEVQFRVLVAEFQALHGIPYIVGAIDGSHIPILAPLIGGEDYYCRKSFHSALLQGIVDVHCKFWDFEFGWAGSLHDWSVFQVTKVGRGFMAGKYMPYKLIGDAAYPVRPWMYCPFKGQKDGLSHVHANWNFIQSSTRMCVERAFGILKGRWRIIMKRTDVPLRMVPDLVCTCIVLHNLCIAMKDSFDRNWIDEAEVELAEKIARGEGRDGSEVRGARAAIEEVRGRIQYRYNSGEDEVLEEDVRAFLIAENEKDTDLLQEATNMHKMLARSLWEGKIGEDISSSSSDVEF